MSRKISKKERFKILMDWFYEAYSTNNFNGFEELKRLFKKDFKRVKNEKVEQFLAEWFNECEDYPNCEIISQKIKQEIF